MAKFKVYVSDYDYPDLSIEQAVLGPIGAEVIGLQCRTGEGLAEQAADADAILQQYARISRETIARLTRCRAICRYGIGVDIVDLEAARERGIIVTNVPDYCLDEVSDHAIALGFTLLRRLPQYAAATRNGRWHWSAGGGAIRRLRGMICGLIGFGRIAQNMVHKLAPFGFSVIAYDPYVSDSYMRSFGVRKVELDQLLADAQIVQVLCPYTPETHHLIDHAALARMRPDAVLVNCTRGKIVDNRALFDALAAGQLASAALDDLEEEPAKLEHWRPENNALLRLDNCIVTPHVAYVSDESLAECRRAAAENARAVLLGQRPPNPVVL
ncbi:C-terminal binding protein [Bradyrhizobium sp. ISRA443]|uniref:C-terminal binding protein n=1 Tax=unclassified Bradyrhizobium TaxID=2631580 RepID=UPI00247AEB87|nr:MULTISPECIES: C-terminal binding protein [unclassified Bradyrhizobium]WGR96434.1 C-terminal binding protein [Bradyrhizobium sp. ISRA436]WGS03320.1 C-terminal binding protein [Bradyrhizobium sp. ISRA437]WGS10204.1 C-terminal binding protein [Bradyrhizobium sp. ISRA443]